MKLLEREAEIKRLVKSDRRDPLIYEHLQKMTYMFLGRKKICRSAKDKEDLSFIIAGDMFMRISEGEEFSYYLGYLDKIYKEYVSRFYDSKSPCIPFDPSVDVNQNFGDRTPSEDFLKLQNEVYLKDIYRVIDEVLDESCKYRRDSKDYVNLRLSLSLSLLRGEIFSFHLDKDQETYLKLLVTRFYSKIKREGLDSRSY